VAVGLLGLVEALGGVFMVVVEVGVPGVCVLVVKVRHGLVVA